MISFDKLVWHRDSRYPGAFEVTDRKTPIYHKCSWDGEPVLLSEATPNVTIKTIEPKLVEFTHNCGQVVRVSFKLWDDLREREVPR